MKKSETCDLLIRRSQVRILPGVPFFNWLQKATLLFLVVGYLWATGKPGNGSNPPFPFFLKEVCFSVFPSSDGVTGGDRTESIHPAFFQREGFMKRFFCVLITAFFVFACGGGGGGGSASSPAWVGTWLIQSENGVDVSALGVTHTLSEQSASQVIPGVCARTGTFSVKDGRFTSTITSNDCPGSYIGQVSTGTLTVSGNRLTFANDDVGVHV